MWTLEFKGNRCTEQPKTQWFIHMGRFKKVTPKIMGKQKGFEICVKTEIMFEDEDETVGILSEYA